MKQQIRQNKNTAFFIGFFLLAGILYLFAKVLGGFPDTLFFCTNFMIYAGLLLFWIQSIRERILPTRARTYILAAAAMMLFYLVMRIIKYRIIFDPLPSRYICYLYFLPILLIPTLLLMTCIRIRQGEYGKRKWQEELLLIPALLLALLSLTNDRHFLIYIPNIDLHQFAAVSGTYSRGIGFYLLYGWVVLAGLSGILMLLLEGRKYFDRWCIYLIGVIALWAGISALLLLGIHPFGLPRMYHGPEINIFCMLAILELCIRGRIIPHNENYSGFFANMDYPVIITDAALHPVYQSAMPIAASHEERYRACKTPVYLHPALRLSGMPIHGGFAFWTEDESALHKEKGRLAQANEILQEENDLIVMEKELQEQAAHLQAKNQVYARIAKALYPKQIQIQSILQQTKPQTPEFSEALSYICLLNAYSKRKSNLLLLTQEDLPENNRELFLALQESARYLTCCKVDAAATGQEYARFSLLQIHALYDDFETIIEACFSFIQEMTISLNECGIRLAIRAKESFDLPTTKLSVTSEADGEYRFVTIHAGRVPALQNDD